MEKRTIMRCTGTCTERVSRFASLYVAAPSQQPIRGEASEDYCEVTAAHIFPVTHDGFVRKHQFKLVLRASGYE